MNFNLTKKLWWIPIFLIIPAIASAQLSGTKVIGTAPSDYTTFTQAVNALNSQGISNSVIFQVKPGTYTEQISLGAVNGTASNKTITFESLNHDSTSVVLRFNASATATNNYVIRLNGTDYVTFREITIQRTDTLAYSQVIDISSGATHNTFSNNIIKGNTKVNVNTYAALVGSTNTLEDSYNVFSNNVFEYGSFGLYYLGQGSTMPDAGTQIINNIFNGQHYRAIYLTSQRSVKINNNIITTSSTNSNYVGIYCQYANDSLRMLKNKLNLSTGTGIYLANCNETSSIRGLIANNFISVAGASTGVGISFNNVKLESVYYNSINISSSSASAGRALMLNGSNTGTLYIVNNVLANTGGGYSYYVDATTTSPITSSNYNDLYTSGSNVGFWRSSGNRATLADWVSASALDANSVSADPLFVSSSDLHAGSGNINGKGTAALLFFSVNSDIDNQIRLNPPDIGADEFSVEDVGISSVAAVNNVCPGTNFNVTVYVRNFSSWNFSSAVPVSYQIQGGLPVNAVTSALALNPGDSAAYTFSTSETAGPSGTYAITASTGLAIDVNPANDGITDSLMILPVPAASAGPDQFVCQGDSATLVASGGVSYTWSTVPAQFTDTIRVLVLDTTDFNVIVSNTEGCIASDTATVYPAIFPAPTAGFTFSAAHLTTGFTNTSTEALTYFWDFGDGNTDQSPNPVHTYAATGSYNVMLIAINPCESDTAWQNFTLSGISENNRSNTFTISPNPATNNIRVVMTDQTAIVEKVELSDVSGRIVATVSIQEQSEKFELDISEFANGLYFLHIYNNTGMYASPFVIAH